MNGMKRKARERKRRQQYTPDGLPRDPNAWTPADWCDLWRAMETVRRKVSQRHKDKRQ